MSFADRADTPVRKAGESLCTRRQALPFQCTIRLPPPVRPTAQASRGETAVTSTRSPPDDGGLGSATPGGPVEVQYERRAAAEADNPDIAGRGRGDAVQPAVRRGCSHPLPRLAVPVLDQRPGLAQRAQVADRPGVPGRGRTTSSSKPVPASTAVGTSGPTCAVLWPTPAPDRLGSRRPLPRSRAGRRVPEPGQWQHLPHARHAFPRDQRQVSGGGRESNPPTTQRAVRRF